jgi:hypothetical protein
MEEMADINQSINQSSMLPASEARSCRDAPIFSDLKFSLRCRPWSIVTFPQQNLSLAFGEFFGLAFMAQRIW